MLEPMTNEFQAAFNAMALTEEHRKTCTAVPCERCERQKCGGCGAPFTVTLESWTEPNPASPTARPILCSQTACLACTEAGRQERALAPFHATIPKRFRWAMRAFPEVLRQIDPKTGKPRVQLSANFIAGALEKASGGCRMIYGDTGSGKTSFIVAVVCAYVRRDWRAHAGTRYVAAQWLAGARARHSLGQGEAPEVLDALTAPLIVLDDLGNDAPDHRNTIADVLFRRHDDELPTWVTTGYPIAHLENRYGVALIRRLIEEPNSLIEMGKR